MIALTVGVYFWLGLPAALLTLAAGTLTLVIFLFWSSLSSLAGQSPLSLEEALHLAAPSAEEEQKRNVLRALKDLEFERSVGKISEPDYQELSTHYRAEAKRLIQALELNQSPAQEEVERWVNEHLEKEGVRSSSPSDAPSSPSKAPPAAPADESAE